jgi:hypothetical protein
MMPIRLVLLISGLLLVNVVRADDDRNPPAHTATTQPTPAVRVEAAPGGGDMVTVGPETQYETHAQVQRDGRLTTRCRRQGPAGRPTDGGR